MVACLVWCNDKSVVFRTLARALMAVRIMKGSVTVLGAGIVGTCCALALQREGFSVCLIDRQAPGSGCSSGNAGMIQTGSVLPLAVPGILQRVPRMLLDPEGPLVLNWGQLPRLFPWLRAFLRNANPSAMAVTAGVLSSLLAEAKAAYRTMAEGTAAQSLFRPRGELYVFGSEESYKAASSKFATYREYGIAHVEMSAAELSAFEPALSPLYKRGYYLPDSEYVVDPQLLTQRLFEAFVKAGGRFVSADVRRLERAPDGEWLLKLEADDLKAERLVISAGAQSGRFSNMLGAAMPVEPLRGYHVMVSGDGPQLAGPVIEGDMNIAATPMLGGIRIAGTLEFSGHSQSPRWRRADMLLPMAKRMLPKLNGEVSQRWFGDRPGMPDSLPVLGAAPGLSNVWYAFGHGQLGLTLAAITGRLLADIVIGRVPSIDVAPVRPGRFVATS